MTAAQERFYRASQWRLMWWRFRRHRVAVVSGALLLAFYLIILFCEFLAPYGLDSRHTEFIYAPPQRMRLFDESGLHAPFVLGYDYRLDMTISKISLNEEISADRFALDQPAGSELVRVTDAPEEKRP